MKKIFLTSSGIPKAKASVFLSYIGKPPSQISVAFIPTAADPKDPDFDPYFIEKSVQELKDIGIKTIDEVDLRKTPSKTLKKKLSKYDVIFVNGGNTFYLLHWMRKSGFTDVVNELLENTGRVYVGVSAGSITAGPSIEMAGNKWKTGKESDRNRVGIKDFTGLNLIDFTVIPHFKTEDKAHLESTQKKVSYRLVPLEDGQMIYLKNGQ